MEAGSTTTDRYGEILLLLREIKAAREEDQKPPHIPLIDPTKNVLNLVGAANKRLDDLVDLHVRRLDDLRNIDAARQNEIHDLEIKRLDELRLLNALRQDELSALHRMADIQLHNSEQHWTLLLLAEKDKRYDERFLTQQDIGNKALEALNRTLDTFQNNYKYYHEGLVNRVGSLERGQYLMMGAIAIAAFVIPIVIHSWMK